MSGKTLRTFSIQRLLDVVDAVESPFKRRDTKWKDRRRIRYRQMEGELKQLPLSRRAGTNQALMVFQTEEPNQDAHRRTKRLIANKPRIEVIIFASDEEQKRLAQDIKDALKALYKWTNRGKVPPERKVVEYQQADGIGIFKADFVADYSDEVMQHYDPDMLLMADYESDDVHDPQMMARNKFQTQVQMYLDDGEDQISADELAYNDVTDEALRKCNPPFRVSAPDPLACRWTMDGDQIDVIVERGTRKVSALLEAYDSDRLRLVGNRFVVWPEQTDAVVGSTVPDNDSLSQTYDDKVEYIEIRTRLEIIVLMSNPKLRNRRGSQTDRDDGKWVRIAYENPFGPYSTGYILVPGDITGSHDPADEYQPAILGTLSTAQHINVLSTIRISAAIDSALSSKYIKLADAEPPSQLDQSKSDKTPTVKDGQPVPQIPGEVRREEAPNVDLDKAEMYLAALQSTYRFQDVLSGDATSSDSGHKLAIQVSQADTQIVPYQNSRAEATAELLMCFLYAAKKLNQVIYVKELPDQGNSMLLNNRVDVVQSVRSITPEMFDLDFNLIVTIGSETPVTKFAKWAALESRYRAGTLSYETLMEQSDVENVADEIARVFEGQTLVAVMQQSIPVIVKMIANRTLMRLNQGQPVQDVVGAGGNEAGGGMPGAQQSTPIAGLGRVPGVGMSEAGPTVAEDGPRVNEGAGDGQVGQGIV